MTAKNSVLFFLTDIFLNPDLTEIYRVIAQMFTFFLHDCFSW